MTALAPSPRPKRRLARRRGGLFVQEGEAPPPYVDCEGLFKFTPIRDARTIDAWIRAGRLPPPLPGTQRGSKRIWKWADVEARLEGKTRKSRVASLSEEDRLREATRAAIGSQPHAQR